MGDRWWEEMACRNSDPAIFEAPPKTLSRNIDNRWAARALELCASCPVRELCLSEYLSTAKSALSQTNEYTLHASMVVGGLLPDQLTELRRRAA